MTAARRDPIQHIGSAHPNRRGDLRVSYRRYAGVRTRVLEIGAMSSAQAPAAGRRRRRRGADRRQPRLVLLHGYCDSADTWRPVLAELAAHGYSAIAVDLPGFGAAESLRPGPLLPQLDAFTAAVVAEQAVLGDVVLAGNSLGGTLGLRAAQARRAPLAGVASIAAPGLVDTWLIRVVAKYPFPLRLYASLPLPVPGFLVRATVKQVVPRLLYANHTNAEAEHVTRFIDQFPNYRATANMLAQARQLVSELADAYRLDAVRIPLLIVACGKDKLVSSASGRRLHSLVPHSRLLTRPDWGHCPQLDDPSSIADLLGYFVASATRGTQSTKPQTTTSRVESTAN